VLAVELQAVLSKRTEQMDWRTLENPEHWRMGWA
jgi:tryptophan-rich hypothetical protein